MRACLFAIIATTLGCSVQPTPWPQTMATSDDDMGLWADGGAAWVDSESTEESDEDTEEAEDQWVEADTESDSQSTAIQQPIDSESTEESDAADTGTDGLETDEEPRHEGTDAGGTPCQAAEQYDPPNGIDDDCDGLIDEKDTEEADTEEVDTCEPCEQDDPPNGIDDDCDGWIDEHENDTNCEEE